MTPNPYPAPSGPPRAPSNRPIIFLALGGVALVCLCGGPAALLAWANTLPEAGVRAGNQLDQKSRALVKQKIALEADEESITFYDGSISTDGSEVAVLTTRRLTYWKDENLSQLAVDQIVQLTAEDLGNDIITATAADGRLIRFEVAPLNDGALFIKALERATGLTANGPAKGAPGDAPADDELPGRPHKRRR
jgi:hypothetical protein